MSGRFQSHTEHALGVGVLIVLNRVIGNLANLKSVLLLTTQKLESNGIQLRTLASNQRNIRELQAKNSIGNARITQIMFGERRLRGELTAARVVRLVTKKD